MNAAVFAEDKASVLADIRSDRDLSLRAIAAEQTDRGIRTRQRGRWGVGNVGILLGRISDIRL